MPIYTNNELSVLFMHIPKTGGTSIENWLRSQKSVEEHLFMKHAPVDFSCTPQHFTYSTIKSIFAPLFPHFSFQFAIVRDPYERLESEFFYRQKLNQLGLGNSPEIYFSAWVCNVLNLASKQANHLDNHLRPQVEFISEDVEVFHFERGISSIMEQVAESINVCPPQKIIHEKASDRQPVYWSLKAINFVNEFYKSDFQSFNYEQKLNVNGVFISIKDSVLECAFFLQVLARLTLRNLKDRLL